MWQKKERECMRVKRQMTFCEYETCPRWDVWLFKLWPSWTVEKMPRLMVQSKVKKSNIQHLPYFVLTLSCQTYTGTIIPAVDRICVGVSPGEVCVVKPIQFTPQRKQSGHFTVHSSCFILILCSALVSWGLMEQGRPQRLRCWLETLTSPLERPQSLVTG